MIKRVTGRFNAFRRERSGFTLAEMLVVIAIITLLSVSTVANFTSLGNAAVLERSARELGLAIRKAQNAALAVSVFTQTGATPPPAVGIRVTVGGGSYLYFGDKNGDGKYDPCCEFIAQTTFERSVKVSRIIDASGAPLAPGTTIGIVFSAPEAVINFYPGGGGTALPDAKMDIELKAPSGQVRTVSVHDTGQITVR
ncbi:MAG: prepilin-type N-terminal cleavage/methylation domain-containing protein [bacterium]|nr:prepilin-type N-terminal cleavage/methylation domain-containing protein [bacterium]MDZ4299732.1 prepilin-type N-terminal cleavage/methylation domain-containing protein [Candidatus Sungbacteria bacterium]